jgi:hypothetical protein
MVACQETIFRLLGQVQFQARRAVINQALGLDGLQGVLVSRL